MSSDRFTGAAAGLTPQQRARIAVFRFGLGPKPRLIARLSRSPNAAFDACWAELTASTAKANVLIPPPRVNGRQLTPDDDMQRCCFAGGNDINSGTIRYQELSRRYCKHLEPEVGLVERLALFWANHFSMHEEKSVPVRSVIGHFERTVVRQHVLGSYPEMLKAAVAHPALIGYLDNFRSTKNAINENLAREILELYTLGTQRRFPNRSIDYTQEDIKSLAGIITGWGISYRMLSRTAHHPEYGSFRFRQSDHDEVTRKVLGQSFGAPGQAKGFAALQWLAEHSYTGQNIATKLLRHFGFDNPPESLVSRLRHIYVHTGGNLLEVSKSLLRMEEVWAAPLRLRPPHLWAVAMARGLGFTNVDFPDTMTSGIHRIESHWQMRLRQLNNAAWGRVTPDGYPDIDAAWLHPDAMRMRPVIAIQMLHDSKWRGYALPNPDTLRSQLLPGSVRMANVSRYTGDSRVRAELAEIFLTSEYMTR
jgi:uncharacterized protein (DUF1800 family)